ncbi:MAG: NFACT RNA binding domain-containing protein [Bacteroidota bacterium]
MNYYELIYLRNELIDKLEGACFTICTTPFKNFTELLFEKGDKKLRLAFSAAPGNVALFLDRFRNPKKSNQLQFFSRLQEDIITNVALAESDRLLTIRFRTGRELLFKVFGNKANVYLVEDDRLVEGFKEDDWLNQVKPAPKDVTSFVYQSASTPKEEIIGLNPLLPRTQLAAWIAYSGYSAKTGEDRVQSVRELTNAIAEQGVFRLLADGTTTLIPDHILPLKEEEIFETISEYIAYRYKEASSNQRLAQQRNGILKALKRQKKRSLSVLRNLEQADKGIEKADEYERFGHLLMANAHRELQNSTQFEVENVYSKGEPIAISVDPALSVSANAERYYQRSANSLKSFEQAEEKKPVISAQLEDINQLIEEIESLNTIWEFREWEQTQSTNLTRLGIGQKAKKGTEQSVPFHLLEINGYTIWIGKNSTNNDLLIRTAHKEDVWMHARGVPGSHLIIRMNNRKEMPPKEVVFEAAAYAAYNSKAKGMKLAPVIVTKNKFVRKPKGSAPGQVIVTKESVEIVEPKKPQV